jgi:hypothetical protein
MKPMAVAKFRFFNSFNSTMGCSWRQSQMTQVTSKIMASANAAVIQYDENQSAS